MAKVILICIISVLTLGGFGVPRIGFGALPAQEGGVSVSFTIPIPPIGIIPQLGNLILGGFAPPGSFLTVLRNKSVSATTRVAGNGTFEVILKSIAAATHEIGFFIEDIEGNMSETLVLPSIPVFQFGNTTIEQVVIPPTFVLETPEVGEGEDVILHGYTAPGASVFVLFEPSPLLKKGEADSRGYWNITLPARDLEKGVYQLRARSQLSSGLFSGFSAIKSLNVVTGIPFVSSPRSRPGEERGPGEISPEERGKLLREGISLVDLNGDGRDDLIDLSILLYNWGIPKDRRADFNKDGTVDLVDFSILLFFWQR